MFTLFLIYFYDLIRKVIQIHTYHSIVATSKSFNTVITSNRIYVWLITGCGSTNCSIHDIHIVQKKKKKRKKKLQSTHTRFRTFFESFRSKMWYSIALWWVEDRSWVSIWQEKKINSHWMEFLVILYCSLRNLASYGKGITRIGQSLANYSGEGGRMCAENLQSKTGLEKIISQDKRKIFCAKVYALVDKNTTSVWKLYAHLFQE